MEQRHGPTMKHEVGNITFPPIAPARLAFLEQRLEAASADQPALTMLRDRLLRLGGAMLVAPGAYDRDIDLLLDRGTLFDAGTARLVAGRASDCHANVARLWKQANVENAELMIATGYGLSEDGLWRQHSWALDADVVVETTGLRLLYFGVVLGPERAAHFAAVNQ